MNVTEQSSIHETENAIHAVAQEKQVHLHINSAKPAGVRVVYIVKWDLCKWNKCVPLAKDRAVNYMVVV